MKVLIRTDSSFLIGTGHILRCLSIARILSNSGVSVTFVCRKLEGNIISFILEKQFKVIQLYSLESPIVSDEIYEHWRGVSLDSEIQEFQEVLELEQPDWVIVDHYSLSEAWEINVRKSGIKIFAIDDLYRRHDCDVLLDQNSMEPHSKFQQLTPKNCKLLIGPTYTLLDESFFKIRPKNEVKRFGQKITVFFGGSDLTSETLKFIRSVLMRSDLNFEIVVGKINKDLKEIIALCGALGNFRIHIQTPKMAEIMKESDLFIGAGGTTTWERCFLGLPAICITTAENQVKIAQDLAKKNVQLYAGHYDQLIESNLVQNMDVLLCDKNRRNTFWKNSLDLKVASKTKEILSLFRC